MIFMRVCTVIVWIVCFCLKTACLHTAETLTLQNLQKKKSDFVFV